MTNRSIKESKIYNYTDIMSDNEVINLLLRDAESSGTRGNRAFLQELKNDEGQITEETLNKNVKVISAASDLLQSITKDVKTTKEAIEELYKNYDVETLESLGNFIKIVHAEDYKINHGQTEDAKKKIKLFSQTSFACPKETYGNIGKTNFKSFQYTYGLDSNQNIRADRNKKNTSSKEGRLIYNIEDIIVSKVNRTQQIKQNEEQKANDAKVDNTKQLLINNRDEQDNLLQSKSDTSMSVILVDSPDIKIGTRNSIEMSAFFNLLSTLELSKCQPYFDATFLIPSILPASPGQKSKYRTASITHFLEGSKDGNIKVSTSSSSDFTNNVRESLDATFIKDFGNKTKQQGSATNMSLFTMPQVVNNFEDVHIGTGESVEDALIHLSAKKRANTILDITRPFMTIKSFSIDVAPTQGLMSFKTGKLSIVLHDKSRMQDIAPFVKPDMFGSFGSEIIVEYGWTHTDGLNASEDEDITNYIGQFLNESRTTEKYIITNSSFSVDNNGQVNIDLSIAARGPVDIRTVLFKTDTFEEMTMKKALLKKKSQEELIRQFYLKTGITIKTTLFNELFSEISRDHKDSKNLSKLFRANRKIKESNKYNKLINKIKPPPNSKAESFIKKTTSLEEIKTNFNSLVVSTSKKTKKIKVIEGLSSVAIDFVFPSGFSIDEKNGLTLENLLNNLQGYYESNTNDGTLAATDEDATFLNVKDNISNLEVADFVEEFRKICIKLVNNCQSLGTTYSSITANRLRVVESVVQKIIGGLDESDPFYNKEWAERYNRIKLGKITGGGIAVKSIEKGQYVSLGSFLVGLIGSHLGSTGKFDEIQIVSYTANPHAGLFSNLNVASLLIERNSLKEFLTQLFLEGADFTVESVISQVVNEFISTRFSANYGLNDFYSKDRNNQIKAKSTATVLGQKYTNIAKANNLQGAINEVLKAIQLGLEENDSTINLTGKELLAEIKTNKNNEYDYLNDVKFVMPKPKLSFDTLTSRDSSYEKTICRISLYDQNDNPFGSINDILRGIYNKNFTSLASKINAANRQYNSTTNGKPSKIQKIEHQKRLRSIIDLFVEHEPGTAKTKDKQPAVLRLESNKARSETKGVTILSDIGSVKIKRRMKSLMPSLTFGSQNSAIIEGSVSTVNEAKLNTVYLTRTYKDKKKTSEVNVEFRDDLPLRVMPAQASVTIFGCPFVNFAQYIFLDFLTGTTIDNTYAITGIKHDLTPGKFTTQLTLSYGDVYGKYENAAATIANALNTSEYIDHAIDTASANTTNEETGSSTEASEEEATTEEAEAEEEATTEEAEAEEEATTEEAEAEAAAQTTTKSQPKPKQKAQTKKTKTLAQEKVMIVYDRDKGIVIGKNQNIISTPSRKTSYTSDNSLVNHSISISTSDINKYDTYSGFNYNFIFDIETADESGSKSINLEQDKKHVYFSLLEDIKFAEGKSYAGYTSNPNAGNRLNKIINKNKKDAYNFGVTKKEDFQKVNASFEINFSNFLGLNTLKIITKDTDFNKHIRNADALNKITLNLKESQDGLSTTSNYQFDTQNSYEDEKCKVFFLKVPSNTYYQFNIESKTISNEAVSGGAISKKAIFEFFNYKSVNYIYLFDDANFNSGNTNEFSHVFYRDHFNIDSENLYFMDRSDFSKAILPSAQAGTLNDNISLFDRFKPVFKAYIYSKFLDFFNDIITRGVENNKLEVITVGTHGLNIPVTSSGKVEGNFDFVEKSLEKAFLPYGYDAANTLAKNAYNKLKDCDISYYIGDINDITQEDFVNINKQKLKLVQDLYIILFRNIVANPNDVHTIVADELELTLTKKNNDSLIKISNNTNLYNANVTIKNKVIKIHKKVFESFVLFVLHHKFNSDRIDSNAKIKNNRLSKRLSKSYLDILHESLFSSIGYNIEVDKSTKLYKSKFEYGDNYCTVLFNVQKKKRKRSLKFNASYIFLNMLEKIMPFTDNSFDREKESVISNCKINKVMIYEDLDLSYQKVYSMKKGKHEYKF